MKPIELSNTTSDELRKYYEREDRVKCFLASLSIAFSAVFIFLLIEAVGVFILKLFNYKIGSFIYNFIFGFGVISTIASIVAVIEEFIERRRK